MSWGRILTAGLAALLYTTAGVPGTPVAPGAAGSGEHADAEAVGAAEHAMPKGARAGERGDASATAPARTAALDTTFAVGPDARLEIENREGTIEVRGWDRSEVRVGAVGRSDRAVEVSRSGSVYRIRPRGFWDADEVDLVVTAPRALPVEISGGESDVTVLGTRGPVTVETIDGAVRVEDAVGPVAARTVDGDLWVVDVRGPVELNSGDGDMRVRRVTGNVRVEGIDGDIELLEIDSEAVTATTVDGDIRYDGRVHPNGRYELVTHDGDLVFTVPEGAGAHVEVSTFDGALRPSFPIEIRGSLDRLTEFMIGDGAARIRLETFSGEIFLVRPGEGPSP